jgi:hypothetical protein
METIERGWLFWPLVHELGREAESSRGVPADTVAAAKRAVAARFGELEASRLDPATRRRVAAYFWGVIRRRALRHAPSYARRIVQATLTADLAAAGWDAPSIRVELERSGLSA